MFSTPCARLSTCEGRGATISSMFPICFMGPWNCRACAGDQGTRRPATPSAGRVRGDANDLSALKVTALAHDDMADLRHRMRMPRTTAKCMSTSPTICSMALPGEPPRPSSRSWAVARAPVSSTRASHLPITPRPSRAARTRASRWRPPAPGDALPFPVGHHHRALAPPFFSAAHGRQTTETTVTSGNTRLSFHDT